MTTKDMMIKDLVAGMKCKFYGAIFEIYGEVVNHGKTNGSDSDVYTAKAKWLEGDIVHPYFGPEIDWTFQGNSRVSVRVIID